MLQKLAPVLFVLACAAFVLLPKLFPPSHYQLKDIGSPELHIGNLGFDTLTLYAHYSECGEWGGHREIIHVYMSEKARRNSPDFSQWKGPLAATWLLDTIGCSYRPDRKYIKQAVIQLTAAQEASVVHYAQALTIRSFKQAPPSHAGNAFSLRYHSTRIELYPADDWSKFDELRTQLFSAAR
ncbi:hypothetical protein ACFPAF_12750 [Hymenobacter endophyticus]|uniref:Uncharacterized protein n=1 Tax=Hymenobacter endophyticus TaxID=3076335 RepID=A0ABU3TIR8_9BACT|nr:hypothetical protein [Hymenobacter endophyticus]MDU0371269.1 hypothetical protein [Hymenobacter endophyticus]